MTSPKKVHTAEELLGELAWMRRLARSLIADEHAAEDVVQESWLSASQARGEIQSWRAWTARIVRNLATSRARSEGRRAAREQQAARHIELPSSADLVLRASEQRRVVEHVLALAEPYRSVILLRYFEELTPEEIARKSGEALGTVKTRLRRALAQLRERLDHAHGGDGRAWLQALSPLCTQSKALPPLAGVLLMKSKLVALTCTTVLLAIGSALLWKHLEPAAKPFEQAALATPPAAEAIVSEQRVQALAPTVERAVASAESAISRVAAAGVALRVVRSGTEEAVPFAEVWYGALEWSPRNTAEIDTEVLLKANGETLRCDAEGRCSLPYMTGSLGVCAKSGELYGELKAWVNEAEQQLELSLAPDRSLSIRVVDTAGVPQAGILVGIRPAGDSDYLLLAGRTTLPDGVATLRHIDQRLPDFAMAKQVFVAAVDGLLVPARELPLDPLSLPMEAISFTLGATGRLVVQLEDAAGLCQGRDWVCVHPFARTPGSGRVERLPRKLVLAENGRAIFEPVDLGLELEISSSVGQYRQLSVISPGPKAPAEEVLVRLRFVDSYPQLLAVLHDTHGSPLADVSVSGELLMHGVDGQTEREGIYAHTDATGKLDCSLHGDLGATVSVSGSLHTLPHGNVGQAPVPILSLEVQARGPFEGGQIDLGTQQMRAPPIFLAGRVVDTEGKPVYWATIDVACKRLDSNAPDDWSSGYDWVPALRAQSDLEGNFICVGTPTSGRYAYKTMARGFAATGFTPFAPGSGSIQIVLAREGSLADSLLLPQEMPADAFQVELRPDASAPGVQSPGEGALFSGGGFHFEAIPPGSYTLQIRLRGREEILHAVPGVVVASGPAVPDPRLEGIDLRALCRRYPISVDPAQGVAPAAYHLAYWESGAASATAYHLGSSAREVRLDTPWPLIDLELLAPGCKPLRLERVAGACRLQPEAGYEVMLELPADLTLPEAPFSLHPLLIPEEEYSRALSTTLVLENGQKRQLYTFLQLLAPAFDSQRRLPLRLPQYGKYRVECFVRRNVLEDRHGARGVAVLRGSDSLILTPAAVGQSFVLRPDPTALQAVLDYFKQAE